MKLSIFLPCLLLGVLSNCQKQESGTIGTGSKPAATYDEIVAAAEREGIPLSKTGLKRNWHEVLAIAALYGLEAEYKDKERENNGLMFCSDEALREHIEQTKQVFEARRQRAVFVEKGKNVQSLSEYFNLLDSLPLYRKGRYKSDSTYEALKKEYFTSDYRFFINEEYESNGIKVAPFLIVMTKPGQMPERKARPIEKR